jgi:hypothetical protein
VKIKQIVELPEGNFTFEGDLGPEEHAFIIEAGITWLIRQGIIPFKMTKIPRDIASYVKPEQELPS